MTEITTETKAALRDAIGLCLSEAHRWKGDKTGDHWAEVARRLRATFFMDEILQESIERVRPIIEREKVAEEAARSGPEIRFGCT